MHTQPSNQPLSKQQRAHLENTVRAAREAAETAAKGALAQLAVGDATAPDYLDEGQKSLRRRLRAHGRALGDIKHSDDSQSVVHLVWEVAYEHWHRMLFARFLAENHLLLWEPGAPVTLAECDEIAQDPSMAMGAKSGWELAGKLAARMLPQVFKPQSPVFELMFAPEHQRELEKTLAGLSEDVFKASDSLGWVYQFWQAKRKDEVNASEVKIGADELPAVTQIFTEPYMVDFLLHNSLGAWWVTRQQDKPCPVPLTYLRTLEDGTPAAGKFEGWPDSMAEFKLLDPCCGSGHFLVAAFLLLVPMRIAAEGLSTIDAVDAVLADNLHGLEIDPRCVEIAVFALALAAWRFLDEEGSPLGVRADMPTPNIACCGLKVAASPEAWEALVPDNAANAALLRQELRLLHASFAQAPLLGSLLDLSRSLKNDLATSSFDTLKTLLEQALASEQQTILWGEAQDRNDDAWDLALSAQGLLEVARLLGQRYNLVVTNVPYLTRGKQVGTLKDFCERHYAVAKNDLANVFLERCLELSDDNGSGVVQVVMPQNWLFLTSYQRQRQMLLSEVRWNLLVRLGTGAFETISGEVVNVILLTQTHTGCTEDSLIRGLDVSAPRSVREKISLLHESKLLQVSQAAQIKNPSSVVSMEGLGRGTPLQHLAEASHGQGSFDSPRFSACFWEPAKLAPHWELQQSTPVVTTEFGGCHYAFRWEGGVGGLAEMMEAKQAEGYSSGKWKAGVTLWGKRGVIVGQMGDLPCSLYLGRAFDENASVIIPRNEENLPAIWQFVSSSEFRTRIRQIDQSIKVTVKSLAKVSFDLEAASVGFAAKWPQGLPEPCSNDPTQWLFHGHPRLTTDALQVAVARLLGYKWPAESDESLEVSDEARTWIARCSKLSKHADDDGIVCLQAVRGEKPAHERPLALLIDAWESVEPDSWKASLLDKLLAEVGCAGSSLEAWLRDKFFEQHVKRFHFRPFIWHIWDGLRDGFGAMVNYHKLDAKTLERLIHTYLGDWIRQQEAGVREKLDGAQQRLAAAQQLKRRLELILEGDAPYDIFVRWKTLAQQPIGWNPDLNDGVRVNIRPFMRAEVLRHNKKPKLNISWDKDRGKDVKSAPWFHVFKGERINDHHLTLAEKKAASGGAHG